MRPASHVYECTAMCVILHPFAPYMDVQFEKKSRNHARPSPAVAGLTSFEWG